MKKLGWPLVIFLLITTACKTVGSYPPGGSPDELIACLPADVDKDQKTDVPKEPGRSYLRVLEALIQAKAVCRDGKLLDGSGREIRFFKASHIGFNKPGSGGINREREKNLKELEELKKNFTVILTHPKRKPQ